MGKLDMLVVLMLVMSILGKSKKFGYWRDTHLRIVGDAVNALQLRFILDWSSQATRDHISYDDVISQM